MTILHSVGGFFLRLYYRCTLQSDRLDSGPGSMIKGRYLHQKRFIGTVGKRGLQAYAYYLGNGVWLKDKGEKAL